MLLSDDSYRALELLRFLRRSSATNPWTAQELVIAIEFEDEDITSRLAPHFHLDEKKEDSTKIRAVIAEIRAGRKTRGESVPSPAIARSTLKTLLAHRWVQSKRGKGYWLLDAGRAVSLHDVLHAFGDEVDVTDCVCAQNPFRCDYVRTCRGHRFYKMLGTELVKLFSSISVEDIALGTWKVQIGAGK